MDGKHPKNADPRPKRRRDKDNPYELFTTGLGTAQPRYYLAFVDSAGIEQCMEIDKALFDVFDRFELDDISFMNEMDRHYEQSEQTEQSLNRRAAQPQKSVEQTVFQRTEVSRNSSRFVFFFRHLYSISLILSCFISCLPPFFLILSHLLLSGN